MATLHLMIGLPCSGKTTYARQLARETNALLLTLDVWHLKLFGDYVGQEHHDERHVRIEKIMWDVAKHVLELGGDLILLSDRPILELWRVQLLICDITIYRLSAGLRPLY